MRDILRTKDVTVWQWMLAQEQSREESSCRRIPDMYRRIHCYKKNHGTTEFHKQITT